MRFCGSTFWFGYGTPVFIRPFVLVKERKSKLFDFNTKNFLEIFPASLN